MNYIHISILREYSPLVEKYIQPVRTHKQKNVKMFEITKSDALLIYDNHRHLIEDTNYSLFSSKLFEGASISGFHVENQAKIAKMNIFEDASTQDVFGVLYPYILQFSMNDVREVSLTQIKEFLSQTLRINFADDATLVNLLQSSELFDDIIAGEDKVILRGGTSLEDELEQPDENEIEKAVDDMASDKALGDLDV